MKRNGIVPQWYQEIGSLLESQQSEIFLLHGDVQGYPVHAGEILPEFLERATLAHVRARLRLDDGDEPSEDLIAQNHLFATLTIAGGLRFPCESQQMAFDRVVAQPTDNPFSQGGDIAQHIARLAAYFRDPVAPPLALVVLDADILFDAEAPMVEPERTLLSYVRSWAARPLVAGNGRPHRIYLVAPSRIGIRSSLLQGRVATIQIPLPNEAERLRFCEDMLGSEIPVKIEEGLDVSGLARITGALNLQQIEDVIYQAQVAGGLLTREMVQERKDSLVRDVYGSVIEIQYPDEGFEALAGYDALKRYMIDYVQPLLRKGDKLCPKGCILSGPPGTGKTEFAKALAASLRLPLVIVQTDKIKSKYVGESNKNMARLTEGIAALAPAIILLDEIDKILPTGDDNTGVSQEILGQLQMFLSDIPRGRAFFVATTNYPSRIPRALLRPGRLEEVIPLLPQHMDGERGTLFHLLAGRMGLPYQKIDWDKHGDAAKDTTGADIERVLIRANRLRVEEGEDLIVDTHVARALEYLVPTVATCQEMVIEALAFCSDKSYIPESMQVQARAAIEETNKRRRTIQQGVV